MLSYGVKIAKIGPLYREIFDEIRQFFWSCRTRHHLRSNVHIEFAISHSVSECQRDESGEFAIFSQNRLPWQCPFRYRKRRSRSIICGFAPKTLSFGEKIAKIGPADRETICLRAIIKKDKYK